MNNSNLSIKYILTVGLLISSMPHRIYADKFTASCIKLVAVTALVCGPFIWCKHKDMREDEQMLAQTDKLLSKMHLEYDAAFSFQDKNNSLLGTILGARLLASIPQAIESLSAQEDVLNKRLIRARTAMFVRQDAMMMKKVETAKKEVVELIKRLQSLLYYLQINSIAVSKEQDAIA